LTSACTGASDIRTAPDAGGRSYARLTIVATGTSLAVTGRLLRYKNLDADSAQILAGAPPYEGALPGACMLIDEETLLDLAIAGTAPDASVRLLDAGEVLVRAAGHAVRLPPRYVPELLPFVTGVAYAAEAGADPEVEVAPSEVVVSAFGGEDVGAFSAAAELPSPPRLSSVGDPTRGAALDLAWEGRGSGTVDIVVTRDAGRSLRCRVADSGRFSIPARALAQVWDSGRADSATVSVERSQRTPFSAPGLDGGDVVVVSRDATTVRVP
jgi:hypothetical protein